MSILKKDFFLVGYISKPHGHKGELQLVFQIDLPPDFDIPLFAFIEISEKLVPFLLTKFEFIVQGKAIIAFEGIDSLDKAERLGSHRIFFEKTSLKTFESEEDFYHFELIGFTVIDEQLGSIGLIEEIEEKAYQPMLIVKNEKGKEILIPLVNDFITKINRKNKQLRMKLPEGLVE